ncbi:MAG: hypothetical protein JWN98_87 [Abditibacteriota bacterium]|nr:hypothetical protein [Abditibacteriota bacterium]
MDSLRIGIIGYDTSHTPTFTRLLNDTAHPHHVSGARVVAGVPTFSPDVASSVGRVEEYRQQMRDELGVPEVATIEEMLPQVDAVLLESVDGRRHLEEARLVMEAHKPLFIDKPLAADYNEARQIVELAKNRACPIFSSSSLRYDANLTAVVTEIPRDKVLSCDAFGPAALDATNPGLFWYGIHGVEILYTFMGQGCQSVRCTSTDALDIVTAKWKGDRLATLRGTRAGQSNYGATVWGEKSIRHATYNTQIPIYGELLKQVVPFLKTGKAPIPIEETLEMMAFMQAALVSQREGREVELREITG